MPSKNRVQALAVAGTALIGMALLLRLWPRAAGVEFVSIPFGRGETVSGPSVNLPVGLWGRIAGADRRR